VTTASRIEAWRADIAERLANRPAASAHVDPLAPVYSIPNAMDTLEQWERWEHRDLASMDYAALRGEYDRIRLRLQLDSNPHPWLIERLQVVKDAGEHDKRRAAVVRHY
jgi:hypothetical protein